MQYLTDYDGQWVPIENILTKRQAEFVNAVCAHPGAIDLGDWYDFKFQKTFEDGEGGPAWEVPLKLELIDDVGAIEQQWIPGKKLLVLDAEAIKSVCDVASNGDRTATTVFQSCPHCGAAILVDCKITMAKR